jgi:hypothetical protein
MGSLLHTLWICWGSITAALALLLIYRQLISMKEEDQLFLDPAEWQLEREQQAIVSQLARLTPFVKALTAASTALLVLIAGVWIYRSVLGFSASTLQP